MLVNDVIAPVQFATQDCSVKLKLSAQCVAEFTALVQAPEPDEYCSETVGLLFGTVNLNVVEVETIRQLPVHGPSPVFERFTRKRLDMLLISARLDPELERLQLVGWYRFHFDGDTRLLPFEIQFHERFFARHEDLSLILTAGTPENFCISVCTRSQDGTFSPTQHANAAIHLSQSSQGEIAVDLQSGPLFSETTYIKPYEALDGIVEENKERRRFGLATAAAAIVGALTGLFLMLHPEKTRTPVDAGPQLSMTLATKGTDLLVSWTGGIAHPKQARLRVFDGDSIDQIDMTKSFKPDHSLTLERRSGNIQAVLLVSDGFRSWQTQSSLIDPTVPRRAAGTSRLNDVERAELNKLRQENKHLRSRAGSARRPRRSR